MDPLLRLRLWAILYTALAVVEGFNALLALIQGHGFGEFLDHGALCSLAAFLALRQWDDVHIAKYQEVRRTWRHGRLAYEHRTDHDGNRSGTRFPVGNGGQQ